MYSTLQIAQKYIQYYLTASNGKGHGIHSPFVFDFINHVLLKKVDKQYATPIETLRKSLNKDKRWLTLQDFGAGSAIAPSKRRTVGSIARNSLKQKKYAQLLHKLVQYYQPNTIIELGSALGLTTAYLASAQNNAKVITMEGASEVAAIAKEVFNTLHFNHIEMIEGNFDETLPTLLHQFAQEKKEVDFAFIDGNHRKKPTIQYFQQILPFTHNESIMVFDDIHWSKGMESAWEFIKNEQQVTLTIDLFFIGIVFFKKEIKEKQHFTIRY